ncbi:acyl-CoA carboxylase subunit epsilon, partial [Streptomonospora algeriensis]
MTPDPSQPAARPAPLLRVVRGDPTPEEVAALVAVLTARAR